LEARELQRVQKCYGNTAIFGGSYGWASAGRFHQANFQLYRLLNLFGGFTGAMLFLHFGFQAIYLASYLLGLILVHDLAVLWLAQRQSAQRTDDLDWAREGSVVGDTEGPPSRQSTFSDPS
jgi:hypothetical protein